MSNEYNCPSNPRLPRFRSRKVPKYCNHKNLVNKIDKVDSFVINAPNFKERVMKEIKRLIPLLEATDNQKKIILEKAKDILDKHISRAIRGDITIRKNANPSTNAAAIIYAVSLSDESIPKFSGVKLANMVGTSESSITQLYKARYEVFAHKVKFDFQSSPLGRSRKIISLYLFKLLLNKKIDISRLALHLEDIIVKAKVDTLEEHNLLKKLTENEIKMYLNMKKYQNNSTSYPDLFTKYFSDLINIIKLLIISNKSHKIIGADFSVSHFVRFLMNNRGINLFLSFLSLREVISDIFYYLRDNSKYLSLFPSRLTTSEKDLKATFRAIIGGRIKLFIMRYLYNERNVVNEIAICPDCLNETKNLTVSKTTPRISSKDFHHENEKLELYSARKLYDLFSKNRGNPYFLPELVNKMRNEEIELKCSSHHKCVYDNAPVFSTFKKLISWKNIPKEFPYTDIFELPAKIIKSLVWVSVDSFPLPKLSQENLMTRKKNLRVGIYSLLKKRFCVDYATGGVCPACGEFNTRVHLPSFDFAHLYKLDEITQEERIRRKGRKIKDLYETLTCSELIREMERQKGGYICSNCHRVLHYGVSNVDKIYDNQNMVRKVYDDNKITKRKLKENLVMYNESIKNPLETDGAFYITFAEWLMALYEISKLKRFKMGVTRSEMLNYLKKIKYDYIFERTEVSKNYITIVKRRNYYYYINDEGRRIVRLMYYFRDYYRNFRIT